MPTISQLPAAAEVTAADEIPLSQSGATFAVTVGNLLASMQPAIISGSGTLLGRISLGPGGPEAISIGPGLRLASGMLSATGADHASFPQETSLVQSDQVVLNSAGNPKLLPVSLLRGLFAAGTNVTIDTAGTISAGAVGGTSASNTITSLTPVTTIATGDLVAISQGGTDHTISYANFLDGLTIDLASPAVAAADTDTLWVAQGSSTMLRQSFAAIWSWLGSKLPTYKLPVVELTANTTLDGTVHNGRVLICSQPLTLSPAPLNMGSGFYCDVLNLSGGNVTFASGITTSSGASSLPTGQAAALRGLSYSGGTVVFAAFSGSGSGTGGSTGPSAPGPVVGLATGGPTTTSVTLTWSAPGSGGTPTGYTVQYRSTGATTWTGFASGQSVMTATVTGLTGGTSYDFQVFATNAQGSGSAVIATASTASANTVTAVTWNMVPSGSYTHGAGSIPVNAHITPGTAPVQFGFATSATVAPSVWVAANYVNSDLWGSYVSTPATAGTWYAWVCGVDGSKLTVYPTPFTVT